MTRVGLVGYGSAGRGIHAPLLAAAGRTVTTVVTRDPGRIAAAYDEVPGVRVVPDLPTLLAQRLGGLDLVVLASPSGVHVEQAEQVVAAGLPVVVDKPLAVDAQQAARLTRRAERAGVPLTVFQNRRYDPDVLTLRRLVAEGELGVVHRAEMRWERWRPRHDDRWRETSAAQEGGGVLLDLHTHMVDAVTQLFGPVETVYAELAARTSVAEDEAFLACRHTSGVRSHLGVSSVAAVAGPRWRVLGTSGTWVMGGLVGEPGDLAELGDLGPDHCGWLADGTSRHRVVAAPADHADFYRQVVAALDSPDPQRAMPVDPWDAVQVLAVLDAARVSARDGTVERVEPS